MVVINSYLDIECIRDKWPEIFIFGAGEFGKGEGYTLLKKAGFSVKGYFDNHVKPGVVVKDNLKVIDISYLYDNKNSVFVFACIGLKARCDIEEQLIRHGVDTFAILGWPEFARVMESVSESNEKIKIQYNDLFDDEHYLKSLFERKLGYSLDLKDPKTFNEKLQWLKLNDRKHFYAEMVDKSTVKGYVKNKIPEISTINTIGVWNSFDEVDIHGLPKRFVLKCTHDSGSVLMCRDKDSLDIKKERKRFNLAMSYNYYYPYREWPYKDVSRRIIAEEYMECKGYNSLPVYKVLCFNGNPTIIQAIENDKMKNESIDYFDTSWNRLDLRQNYPNSTVPLKAPDRIEEMLDYASILSTGHPFIRVDFYEIDNRVFFSEFTFYSDSGLERFYPEEWDNKLGSMIQI